MANNSAFILMIFTTWCNVLTMALLQIWMWVIDVATLFFMLVLITMRVQDGSLDNTIAKLSSIYVWDMRLLLLHLLKEWKEKWLEKLSIIQEPEENSGLNRLKEENTLLNLLSISIMGPLIFSYWY